MNAERPRTAPNGAGGPRRLKKEQSRGPPVSFRRLRTDSVSSNLRINSDAISHSFSAPLTPLQPPGTPFRYKRSDSVHSIGSGRGFVDLLDAQSELKPQGFQTRVRAAGAKDFGEDVADRNIGANAPDVKPSHLEAFFAGGGHAAFEQFGSAPSPDIRRSKLSSGDRVAGSFETGNPYGTLPSHHAPFMNGLAQNPIRPQDERQIRMSRHLSQTGSSGRRQSLSSYIPSAPSTYTAPLPRPQSMHRPTRSGHFAATERRSVSAAPAELPARIDEFGSWSKYSHLLPKSEPEPPPSPSFARDSVLLARSNYSLPSHSRTPDRPYRESRSPDKSGSDSEGSTRHGRVPQAHNGFSQEVNRSAGFQAQAKRQEDMRSVSGGLESLERPEQMEAQRPMTAGTYSPSPRGLHIGNHSQNDGWDTRYSRARGTAPYGRLRLDEIYEHIPTRTSSLVPTSVASTTPTVSSTSSSHFPRPQSRHTPNTSIDLATISSQGSMESKSPTSATADDASSYWTALEDRSPINQKPTRSPTYETATASFQSTFNIDDYLSSDDEFDGVGKDYSRRTRGEDEGQLLFQDSGYGGLQLPGLYDHFPGTDVKMDQRMRTGSNPNSDDALPAVSQVYSQGVDDSSDRQHAQEHEPNFRNSEVSSTADVELATVPREDLATGRKGMTRISALGTAHHGLPSPIAEEREDKVDIRTAIRLRKEAKARKRAEGENTAREKIAVKRKQSAPGMERNQPDEFVLDREG